MLNQASRQVVRNAGVERGVMTPQDIEIPWLSNFIVLRYWVHVEGL